MRVLFLGGAVKVEVHSLVWKSIKFATASREGGRPAPAMTLLRVYFLGLKNRGNRGTMVCVRINGLKCGVIAVMHYLHCSAFSLARLLK